MGGECVECGWVDGRLPLEAASGGGGGGGRCREEVANGKVGGQRKEREDYNEIWKVESGIGAHEDSVVRGGGVKLMSECERVAGRGREEEKKVGRGCGDAVGGSGGNGRVGVLLVLYRAKVRAYIGPGALSRKYPSTARYRVVWGRQRRARIQRRGQWETLQACAFSVWLARFIHLSSDP